MSTISNLIFNNEKHYVTSPFGNRAAIKTSAGTTGTNHEGTDYGTDGKKIAQYAIEDGYVFAAAKSNSDGANYVWVIYPRVKLAMLHYHLDSYAVKSGQKVSKLTLLGYTGSTGRSTGVHLHLGIRDCKKLSDKQINNMTWDLLRTCAYVNPETVAYSEAPVEQPKPADPPKPVDAKQTSHTVVAGDTLSSIATKYGTTVDDIVKANPAIKNPNLIYAGDVFVIPNAKNVENPVENVEKPVEVKKESAAKSATKGAELKLSNESLYASAYIDKVANKITGTYYVYDGQVLNGRVRITNNKNNVGKFPLTKFVTGWVKI